MTSRPRPDASRHRACSVIEGRDERIVTVRLGLRGGCDVCMEEAEGAMSPENFGENHTQDAYLCLECLNVHRTQIVGLLKQLLRERVSVYGQIGHFKIRNHL